ncbi:MAG: UbiA family prenyltransferase [Caldilineaceae bacterium]
MTPITENPNTQSAITAHGPLWQRLWIYQHERFPLFKHGLLIASFSFCAVCLSALLRSAERWPSWQSALTAFVSLLFFFLQLRIADEFKDAAIDAQYRPERPVPRGLITLSELGWVAVTTALLQIALALWLEPLLLLPLVAVWGYMALMRVEFGIPQWLHRHPFTYLWTHMLIVPLIDFYATACDWLSNHHSALHNLAWFLAVSFFNGVVIELGRKTWAPAQERTGVESYSGAWGIQRAVTMWLLALALAFLCALVVASAINFFWPVFILLAASLIGLTALGIHFVHSPTAKGATAIEMYSGLWVAGLYLILGIVPLGVQQWF